MKAFSYLKIYYNANRKQRNK